MTGTGVTWAAVAGLVLALISLGWQVYNAIAQRPRFAVLRRGRISLGGPPLDGHPETHHIVVVNDGGSAGTIQDVGFRVESEAFANLSVQQVRDDGIEILGPDLPCRVDSHDAKTWVIAGDLLAGRLADIGRMYAWAEYFTPPRRWGRPSLRKIGTASVRSADTVAV